MKFGIYALIFIASGVVMGSNQAMQRVTLLLGKYLVRDNELAPERGLQDAITPRSQNWSNNILMASFALFFAGFFLFAWYLPLVALLGMFVAAAVYGAITAEGKKKFLLPYVGVIIGDLARRSADYSKAGDNERSQAAKDVAAMVTDAIEELNVVFGDNPTVKDLESLVNKK